MEIIQYKHFYIKRSDVKKYEQLLDEFEKQSDFAQVSFELNNVEPSYNIFYNKILKENKIKIYTKLEANRKNLNLTRKKLSELSGISHRTIEAYEQGRRNEESMPLNIYKTLYKAMGKQFID